MNKVQRDYMKATAMLQAVEAEEKEIKRLGSLEEAMQMIQILDYDECIAVLKGVERMPAVMHKAIIDRAKSFNGVTAELIIAGIQAVVNQ